MTRFGSFVVLAAALAALSGLARDARAGDPAPPASAGQELMKIEDERQTEVTSIVEEAAKEMKSEKEAAEKEGKADKWREKAAELDAKRDSNIVKCEKKFAEKRAAILAKPEVANAPADKEKAAKEVAKIEQARDGDLKKADEEHAGEAKKCRDECEKEGKPEKAQAKLAELEAKYNAKLVKLEQSYADKRMHALKAGAEGGGKDHKDTGGEKHEGGGEKKGK